MHVKTVKNNVHLHAVV